MVMGEHYLLEETFLMQVHGVGGVLAQGWAASEIHW